MTDEAKEVSNRSGNSRQKYWCELSDAEKIERMRNILKATSNEISRLRDKNYYLENLIKSHKHLDGDVVKSIKFGDNYPATGKLCASPDREAKGEVFF